MEETTREGGELFGGVSTSRADASTGEPSPRFRLPQRQTYPSKSREPPRGRRRRLRCVQTSLQPYQDMFDPRG